jgi:hypothetical protein
MSQKIPIYLETGKKRTFAGALDWPGWNRIGRNTDEALQVLLASAPRFARVLDGTGLDFTPPTNPDDLVVVERLEGTATTDFGAPDALPSADREPLDEASAAASRSAARRLLGRPLRPQQQRPQGKSCAKGRAAAGAISTALPATCSTPRRAT